jgi:YteA family regulatory protein
MDTNSLSYYKKMLINEKERISELLLQMKRNDTIDSDMGISAELSWYDNHPSDVASELDYKEKGMALKANEVTIMNKVEAALKNIEDGSYGICKRCGIEIPRDRLDFVPYVDKCVECKELENKLLPREMEDRPIEEIVLGKPFGYGYNDNSDDLQYDAEDSYQDVDIFNRRENIVEYYEDDQNYVDPIESISNEQYKNQLPY